MGIKFSEQEFNEILKKNPKIKINQDFGGNKIEEKITLQGVIKKENKKYNLEPNLIENKKTIQKTTVVSHNKNIQVEIFTNDKEVVFWFNNAKLLTLNQILAFLQIKEKSFQVFNYKKQWHRIIQNSLIEHYKNNKIIPYFDKPVELILFRQGKRLVDQDSLPSMFKYIIDALKKTKENPYGILPDDNPKFVQSIKTINQKGENMIGIKIKILDSVIENVEKENFIKL